MQTNIFSRFIIPTLLLSSAMMFLVSTGYAVSPCNAFVNTCSQPSSTAWTVNDTLLSSTGEAGEPQAHSWYTNAQNPLTTNWYHWTAPQNGMIVVNTQGTNPNAAPPNYTSPYVMDMVIAAYTGTTLASLVRVNESDDWQPSSPPNSSCTFERTLPEAIWSSCMMFPVTAGTTYHFQVDYLSASNPANNNFVLNLYYRAPTAAMVSISGRATDTLGRGISRAQISLTDMNGNVRSSLTSSFGYYMIEGVEAGQSYILQAAGKKITFVDNPRILSIIDDLAGEDFVEGTDLGKTY